LNWNNNPNNSIHAGISSNQKVNLPAQPQITTDLQYGSPAVSEPGDIVIEGRFNNHIVLGKQNEVGSSIKLVAGSDVDEPNNINKSKASIFIQDGGTVKIDNPNKAFPSTIVTGAKIVLNADDIVINARNTLKIQSGEVTEVIGKFVELKHNAGGQVITGETEQFVEELRERAVKEVTDVIDAEVQVLKDTANIAIEEYNKQVQNIKNLTDSVKDARKNVEKTIKAVRNTSFTMNGQKFTKLQDQVNRLQTELASTPPTDPVRIARLGLELTNVFRSFITLDFLNKDIVTIEQKK
jgi:F0F1-type ATP synthase membrane subunit b/b'